MRKLVITDVKFGCNTMKLLTFISSWGEDDSIVGDSMVSGGYDETESISLWRYISSKLNINDIVIDIGAYVGFWSIIATLENRNIRSIAFEPSSATYGRLLSNIYLNGLDTNILPCHLAISNNSNLLKLKHHYGVYSITSGDSSIFEFKEDHCEKVEAIKLDDLLTNDNLVNGLSSKSMPLYPFNNIGAIKIDVEGAELLVLESGISLIKKYSPIIIAEALTTEMETKLLGFCKKNNYFFYKIKDERNILMLPSKDNEDFFNRFHNWKLSEEKLDLKFERHLELKI